MIPRPCPPDKSAPNEVLHVVLSKGVLELPEADADEFQKKKLFYLHSKAANSGTIWWAKAWWYCYITKLI